MPAASSAFITDRSPASARPARPQPSMGTPSEVSLRQSSSSRGQLSPKSGPLSPACAERCVAFLRQRHPHKTPEAVEAATGGAVPADTVKKWLARASAPGFRACFALIGAYGPDFIAAVMERPPDWLCDSLRAERLRQLSAQQAAIAAEISRIETGRLGRAS